MWLIVSPPYILVIFFSFFNFIATLFIYLFIFGCVGSSVRARAFSSCGKWGPLFIAVWGPLFIAVRGPFTIAASSRCGAQAPDAQAQQLWLTGPAAPWHVGSSQTRAQTRVPCIGRQILNHCATREALNNNFFFIATLFIYLFIYFWLC